MPTSDETMTVLVKLPAALANHRPDPGAAAPFAIELAAASTVGDLVARLGIPAALAKLVFVDHRQRRLDDPLMPGASVEIFPPIGGG